MRIFIFILLIGLFGCYSEKKATQQFAKASVIYPNIPAEYCARIFPPKDTTIRDTTTTTDTLYVEPEVKTDTLFSHDTLTITITKTLPGKTITNTVIIRDTIKQTNTAELDACRIDNSELIGTQKTQLDKYDKRTKGRNNWRTIALCSLVVNLLVGFLMARKFFKPKVA